MPIFACLLFTDDDPQTNRIAAGKPFSSAFAMLLDKDLVQVSAVVVQALVGALFAKFLDHHADCARHVASRL